MNIQKSLYRSLLRLGINMIRPLDYMVSKADHHPDLVFGFLEQEGHSMYILLANYLIEERKALPEPEVVLKVSPEDNRATVFTCEWPNNKELSSTALDRHVNTWLEKQVSYGHTFLRPSPVKKDRLAKERHAVALRVIKGGRSEMNLKREAVTWVKGKQRMDVNLVRLTIDVAPDIHQKLKVKCAMERITIADMVRGWMEEKLREPSP
jgi:hypothetical protein